MINKSVVAICPGDSVTGGPELIHQFVDRINENGGDAKILYYPFGSVFQVPNAYLKYNVNVCSIDDLKNKTFEFVVPEISTVYIKELPGTNFNIWWLSVDNYFKYKNGSFFSKIKLFIKKLIKYPSLPLTINQLKKYKHWVQSYYAQEFLGTYGIESTLLSDFLNNEHLNQDVDIFKKENIICFNPKKGISVTNQLIDAYPNYKFVPIQNMTAKEVSELLQSSKIYMDFGNHPGKDRIPREAAMAKCVVITGTKGSAKNKYDIAVDSKYKIDEEGDDFCAVVGKLFQDVFDRFEHHIESFEPYLTKIASEEAAFNQQVLDFMRYTKGK
jgi:hypothetical protein